MQSPKNRSNFFNDVRKAFNNQVAAIFEENGIATFRELNLGDTSYLRNSRVIPGDSIIKFSGWHNDIRQVLDFEFCARYGHDDYSLKVENLPKAPPSAPVVNKKGQVSLFDADVGQ